MTVFHQLISKDASGKNNHASPSNISLYEESQALFFGGADTVGNTLMNATFYLARNPEKLAKLKDELRDAWPDMRQPPPKVRELEKLPYLNAVIKESLRVSIGVVAGLWRVVPDGGATICGTSVPGGVSIAALLG